MPAVTMSNGEHRVLHTVFYCCLIYGVACKNLIVTAATNGAIVIWDLNKTSGQKQGFNA